VTHGTSATFASVVCDVGVDVVHRAPYDGARARRRGPFISGTPLARLSFSRFRKKAGYGPTAKTRADLGGRGQTRARATPPR